MVPLWPGRGGVRQGAGAVTRAEWLELRRSGIGGSDMPSLLGICPFGGTPYGVWKAKVHGAVDKEPTPDMQRGNFLEPIIRDLYRQETGYEVQTPSIQRHLRETWAIANLDGLVIPGTDENGLPQPPGILEIKAPRIGKFCALEDEGIPANYQVQMQHYMGVTGLKWGHFCAWNADAFRLLIVRIERDDDLISLMWDVARDFWIQHVLTGIPPSTGPTEMVHLPSLEPRLCIMDSPEWTEASDTWREATAIFNEAEAYEDQCRERLVRLALESGKAKVKGNDVSVSIDKNGVPRVRDSRKEQAA